MVVKCLGFGRRWNVFRGDRGLFTLKFFNTTGNGKPNFPYRPGCEGRVRINGRCRVAIDERDPAASLVGQSFLSPGVEITDGRRQLLLEVVPPHFMDADAYLVCVRSNVDGRIDWSTEWKTPGVQVVSSSVNNRLQETLILMGVDDVIRTIERELDVTWFLARLLP